MKIGCCKQIKATNDNNLINSIFKNNILLLVYKYAFIIFRDDRNDRYGPPTRTNYRLIVENLSSRVSWQVRNHIYRC